MHRQEITYKDLFDDTEHTETFYFHISNAEVIDLEVEHPEGLGAWLQKIMDAKDNKTLWHQFKDMILLAYGQRDGSDWNKDPKARDRFERSPAFEALLMEFLTTEDAAADFMMAVLPKEMAKSVEKEIEKNAPAAPTEASTTVVDDRETPKADPTS